MLNFNELASTSTQTIGAYHRAGYTIDTSATQAGKFIVFGSSSSTYPFSPALASASAPSTITLSRDDGSLFGISQIDLTEYFGGSQPFRPTVNFTGLRPDGSSVFQSFRLDGFFGPQTFFFSGFTGLSTLSWAFTNSQMNPV